MNNQAKYLKYTELMEKLNEALKNEFYYEAIFIEYAIIEDRTSSMLKHAKFSQTTYSETLDNKLNVIKTSPKFKNEYVEKHLTKEFIQRIYNWKKHRNDLIHKLAKEPYSNEFVKKVAIEGNEVLKILKNKSKLINDYSDKNIKSML